MSGAGDDDDENIAPSFEEQVKFLRRARQKGSTRFQKTTEFNVLRKLKYEVPEAELDQTKADNRLDKALNRETGEDIFGDSISKVLGPKLGESGPKFTDEFVLGKATGKTSETAETGKFSEEAEEEAVEETEANESTAQSGTEPAGTEFGSVSAPGTESIESEPGRVSVSGGSANPAVLKRGLSNFFEETAPLRKTAEVPVAPPPEASYEPFPAAPPLVRRESSPFESSSQSIAPTLKYEAKSEAWSLPDESEIEETTNAAEAKTTNRVEEHTTENSPEKSPEELEQEDSIAYPGDDAGAAASNADTVTNQESAAMDDSDTAENPQFTNDPHSSDHLHDSPAGEAASPIEFINGAHADVYRVEFVAPELLEPEEAAPGEPEIVSPEEEFSRNYILTALQFKEETGLELILDDKNILTVMLNASGENISVYTVDFSPAGLEEIRVFAKSLTAQYVDVLTHDFGVEFGKPGEAAIRQLVINAEQQVVQGKQLLARSPRLDELKALHRAIEYSWPATYQLDDQLPLNVVCVNDTLIEGDDAGAVLKYMEDGRPILFVSPSLGQRGRPTEKDAASPGDFESWQATLMRELAWKSAVDCAKFPLSAEEIQSLGWVPLKAPADGSYALKNVKGQLFRPYEQAVIAEQAWARCDTNGQYQNKLGKPARHDSEICFVGIEEMALQAEVVPAGFHFFNAEEEIVDALCCFRQGSAARAQLSKVSPQLYRAAKLLDQLSIDRCYVPSKSYAGLIRSPGGSLIENNSANQRELQMFEQAQIKQV